MSLELLNTLGTLTTAAVIAATAIAALVQLRHLRAGNQINAMLNIGNQFVDNAFRNATALVQHKGSSALDDPVYREYELAIQRRTPTATVPEEYVRLRSAVLLIGNMHEELGILVKNGIVDKHLFLDRYSWVIARNWSLLEGYTAYDRAILANDAIWENFEYLTVLSQDWMREHPSTYPKGVRRIQLHNPWPVPPVPATT